MSALRESSASRAVLVRFAALLLAAACVLPARAGGPLQLVNRLPVVYPNGGVSLTLNLDQGPLGPRSNAQAAAIVQSAIGLWNGVATSTMRLGIGASLSTDYTVANYSSLLSNFSDGINPIIFDTDGAIIDAVFGAGAKTSILGFAGSNYWTSGPSAGRYIEGRAVLNGSINISDATLTVVLAHEIGHYFGLDHAQLDNTQGLAGSNYVLMYPIAYRSLLSLHEDDVAAVTALYPTANTGATYGQLAGTFTTAGGTAILGANVWAKETTTGKVYSVVSDYLTEGTGYFRLRLPGGTYTLNAESISTNFNGGSGVGPYSDTATSESFQSPHPITPVALGGGSPQQITIVAGCSATATFRLDGTGGVTGNCGASAPVPTTTALASTANPATTGASVTLTATVVGNAPTGTVAFTDGGIGIAGCGTVALAGSGNARTAACTTSFATAATHNIVAAYGGNAGNQASTSAVLGQVVNAVASTRVLTVTRSGTGSGTVTSSSAGINCGADCTESYGSTTSVVLTATPAGGSVFMGWLGACIGTGTCTVSVSAATAVSATFAPNSVLPRVDVDGNGNYDALTDGLLILRGLFGITGTALTNGAIGAGFSRSDPGVIAQYLGNIQPLLDIDGNGRADALTDGVMIIRYLFGVRGPALISGAIGSGATRPTAPDIEQRIAALSP